jgi:hypothetical protein
MMTLALLVVTCVACSTLPVARGGRVDPGLRLKVIAVAPGSLGGVTATLRLTNVSDEPFTYAGYSVGQPSDATATEVWHGLRWRSNPLVGCGTGVRTLSLAAGDEIEFLSRART